MRRRQVCKSQPCSVSVSLCVFLIGVVWWMPCDDGKDAFVLSQESHASSEYGGELSCPECVHQIFAGWRKVLHASSLGTGTQCVANETLVSSSICSDVHQICQKLHVFVCSWQPYFSTTCRTIESQPVECLRDSVCVRRFSGARPIDRPKERKLFCVAVGVVSGWGNRCLSKREFYRSGGSRCCGPSSVAVCHQQRRKIRQYAHLPTNDLSAGSRVCLSRSRT